jgi:competence protein ComEA
MKWREFVKDYLNFSRKERIAVLTMAAGLIFIILLPDIIPSSASKNTPPDTSWFSEVRKLQIKQPANETNESKYEEDSPTGYQFDKTKSGYTSESKLPAELFYFDPNKATSDDWERLGLKEKTAQTILNYLGKGGKFRKPKDLQKIYGLRQTDYERLEPYIRIENIADRNPLETFPSIQKGSDELKPNTSRYSQIEINSADTSSFISLPGIGSKLAARIVNFRDKLGGFYSIDQISETYGLPDSTFQNIKQWLKLDNTPVKKININTATVDEMKTHPYIKYSLANPIVAYRNEHGQFSKIEDIKNVMAVTEDIYKKIEPYLSIK